MPRPKEIFILYREDWEAYRSHDVKVLEIFYDKHNAMGALNELVAENEKLPHEMYSQDGHEDIYWVEHQFDWDENTGSRFYLKKQPVKDADQPEYIEQRG